MINGVMPKTFGRDAIAHCVTLYDWDGTVNESWIEMSEKIFDALGTVPAEGTGNVHKKHTHGSYSRIKKRLRTFLEQAPECGEFDVRIRSAIISSAYEASPSEYEIVFSGSERTRKKMCVAARHGNITSLDHLISLIGEIILGYTGVCYGAAFDFPAEFSPSCYLSSIGFLYKGIPWGANQAYTDRITRWSKRAMRGDLSPRTGYFREVYEINLLNDAHLNASFRDSLFRDFAKSVGVIQPLPYCNGMYRWDVPRGKLQEVQEVMESSGLVLSS
jgi:hypothetical protein